MVAIYQARQGSSSAHARVLWDDPQKQHYRFCELLEFVDFAGDASILDVGCGNGELYAYLIERGFCGSYLGVDINTALLGEAKSRFPRASFAHVDDGSVGTHDYVLMSGLFNANAGQSEQWVHDVLSRYFALCTRALVFNAVSGYVSRRDDHLFYLPPAGIIDFVVRRLSPVFEIRHGFLPFNYTVCVRRRPDWRSVIEMNEESQRS
jgi:SAM-dependent methyltransferase